MDRLCSCKHAERQHGMGMVTDCLLDGCKCLNFKPAQTVEEKLATLRRYDPDVQDDNDTDYANLASPMAVMNPYSNGNYVLYDDVKALLEQEE